MKPFPKLICTVIICGTGFVGNSTKAAVLAFSDEERAIIENHGPWPPPPRIDPSNRVSGEPEAIELGRRLFFDEELSVDGTMSCATCHDPDAALSDGHTTGSGRAKLPRNTPALFNLGFARWFGWDGGADSLWAQSLRPIMAPQEMAATATHVADRVRKSTELSCLYQKSFGRPATADPEQIGLVNAAKALAAFQETLVTGRTAFDEFRDALLSGNTKKAGKYPQDAQRGLKLFVGKGRCHLCHFGPQFTNGEFGDIGISFFLGKGKVDKGRYGGIQKLKSSPYGLSGPHSDDISKRSALKTRRIKLQDRNWGEFKIPSLRNVAKTAPYMHAGSLTTLFEVVRHYSEIDEERLHVDGEKILRPLRLTGEESNDLVAFLESLSVPLIRPVEKNVGAANCSITP